MDGKKLIWIEREFDLLDIKTLSILFNPYGLEFKRTCSQLEVAKA
jgi:hypothetical protein